MIVIITKEKHTYSQKSMQKIDLTIIILYINRRSVIEYIVLGINCVRSKDNEEEGSKEERKMGKKQLRPSIRSLPSFKANEGKSSQKLCMILIIELFGLNAN